jgi:hypothetical protein
MRTTVLVSSYSMRSSMDLHVNAQTPSRWPGAQFLTDVIEGDGLPWGPALPRERDGVGITPNAVARAIEDLQRSGYRPLHARLAAPEPSSTPRARAAPGRDV